MAFTFQLHQLKITSKLSKKMPIFIFLLALVFLVVACGQDYLQAQVLHQGFFLSESLLFKSFLLPLVPIVLLLCKHRSKLHTLRWSLIFVPPIAATFHLVGYALLVSAISAGALDHTYNFTALLQRAIADDLYKYIAVYLIAVAIIRNQHEYPASLPLPSRIIIQNGKESTALEVSNIFWINADDPYISIHAQGRSYLSNITLKAIEAQLDPSTFVRIHRSTIISLQQVESYHSRLNGDYDVKLKCGAVVRASRRYSKQLQEKLSGYSA